MSTNLRKSCDHCHSENISFYIEVHPTNTGKEVDDVQHWCFNCLHTYREQ